MTDHLFIDQDGDACLEPSGRKNNLVALPARDDDGNILNPEAWEQMVRAFNEANTAIPRAEADAMVAAAFDSIRNKLIPAMRGDAAACATTHPEISEDRLDYAEMLEEILSLAAKAPARAAFEQAVREAVEAERERLVALCELQRSGLASGIDEGVRRCIAAIRSEEPSG